MSHDAELGKKVKAYLSGVGIETPMTIWSEYSNLTEDQTQKAIEGHVAEIMKLMKLDLRDDSLMETPHRVAKMYMHDLYRGLNYDNFPKCTVIENKMASELVCVKEIEVSSTCEHHLVTIDGKATIAYIPAEKVIGLSKINRIVSFFARRPQVQERLTNQIWHTLNYILGTPNIAVYIDATHYCVKARGVRDASSTTVTNKLGGDFITDPLLRSEFMSIARNA